MEGFADDIIVIFSSVKEVLILLELKAGVEFQLAKCVSLHFNGCHIVSSTQFVMSSGHTI